MSGFFRKTLSFFGLADEEELEVEEKEGISLRERRDFSQEKASSLERPSSKRPPRN